MIPNNITEEHIILAINEIMNSSIPKKNLSTKHILIYNNLELPPKYVISIANKFANGKILSTQKFSGGPETNDFLRNLHFTVIEKTNHSDKGIKTLDLKNHKIYKLSMGTFAKDIKFKNIDPVKIFEQNGLVVMSQLTSKSQGENFKTKMNIGDYVYVTYGYQKLSNVYRIASDYSIANEILDIDLDSEWICRKVELIQKSVIQNTSDLKTNYKAWLPSGNTTFVEITDVQKANEILFNKYYNLNFVKSNMRNYKKEYIKWLNLNFKDNSGAKNSYPKAIEILSEILGSDLFEEDNIEKLLTLYEELIKEQRNIKGKYYHKKAPSYGNNGFYSASIKTYINFLKENSSKVFKDSNIYSGPLNQILYGPPGTGKTYSTKELAVNIILGERDRTRDEILKKYDELQKNKQITFTTFHQSISYEDFIEGIKPETANEIVTYEVKDGVFKQICDLAKNKEESNFDEAYSSLIKEFSECENEYLILKTPREKEFRVNLNSNNNLSLFTSNNINKQGTLTKLKLFKQFNGENAFEGWEGYASAIINYLKSNHYLVSKKEIEPKNYVLIIDEINRGNISSIFGELITLLEEDKRKENKEEIEVILPYSKEKFSVPNNLYIVGTMNTADRSVEALDTALRRRFSFTEIQYNPDIIEFEHPTNGIVTFEDVEIDLITLLNTINERIEILIDKDHKIGHSYFINIETFDDLKIVFKDKVIPLLEEYFFGDFGKIGLVLGGGFIQEVSIKNKIEFAYNFSYEDGQMLREKPIYKFIKEDKWNENSFISIYSNIKKESE